MAPRDLFVSLRQFFGYVVSGGLWVLALTLGSGRTFPTEGFVWTAALVLAVFAVGFSAHGPLFSLVLRLSDRVADGRFDGYGPAPKDVRLARSVLAGRLPPDDPLRHHVESLEGDEVLALCKRVLLEEGDGMRARADDLEGTVNFIVALVHGAGAASVGAVVDGLVWQRLLSPASGVAALGAAVVLSLLLLRYRLPKKRAEERTVWIEGVLVRGVVAARAA